VGGDGCGQFGGGLDGNEVSDVRNGHHGRGGDVRQKVLYEYVRRLDLVVFSGDD
jgi:hypothetical protein